MPPLETLSSRLGTRNNGLNAVRLALASVVILGHAWPLTGSSAEPRLEFLSGLAVDGFFAVSGYLIAASRISTGIIVYFWRRILRIFPGLLVCLVITACVIAPIAASTVGEQYSLPSAASYLASGFLLQNRQYGIDGTLVSVPYPDVWNGSLWTLQFEFLAYIALGLLLSVPWVRKHGPLLLPVLTVATILMWAAARGPLDVSTHFYLYGMRLGSYFLVGASFYFVATRTRVNLRFIALAGVIVVLLAAFDLADSFAQIPLAYLLLALGSLPATNATTRIDLSYGSYIYAFPVQQTLVLAGTASWGIGANSAITLAITLLLAWVSWTYVEKPALRLKNVSWRLKIRGTKPLADPVSSRKTL